MEPNISKTFLQIFFNFEYCQVRVVFFRSWEIEEILQHSFWEKILWSSLRNKKCFSIQNRKFLTHFVVYWKGFLHWYHLNLSTKYLWKTDWCQKKAGLEQKITTSVFDQSFHGISFRYFHYFRSTRKPTIIQILGSLLPAGSNKTQIIDIHWHEDEIILTIICEDSNTNKNAKTTN